VASETISAELTRRALWVAESRIEIRALRATVGIPIGARPDHVYFVSGVENHGAFVLNPARDPAGLERLLGNHQQKVIRRYRDQIRAHRLAFKNLAGWPDGQQT